MNSALGRNGGSHGGGWRPLVPVVGATEVISVRRTPDAGVDSPAEEQPHGLFGPQSVTWRVHADPLLGVAALRSLTLRSLLPAGIAGVLATARDGEEPWEVVQRSASPLLAPETNEERVGTVPNVVFPTAVAEIDGVRFVFYGMADTSIGVARLIRRSA